jgi:hypothetical protein
MRRPDDERAPRAKAIDDRHAERAAFEGIRARADLVEQDERRQLEIAIHRRDVRDVPAERAEAGGDRLLVADVGEDRRRPALSSRARRDVQAACAMSGKSPPS